MSACIGGSEAYGLYLSVNLSGRDGRVAQEFLNCTEICASLEQMSGERVPKRVRVRLAQSRCSPLARTRPRPEPAAHV